MADLFDLRKGVDEGLANPAAIKVFYINEPLGRPTRRCNLAVRILAFQSPEMGTRLAKHSGSNPDTCTFISI